MGRGLQGETEDLRRMVLDLDARHSDTISGLEQLSQAQEELLAAQDQDRATLSRGIFDANVTIAQLSEVVEVQKQCLRECSGEARYASEHVSTALDTAERSRATAEAARSEMQSTASLLQDTMEELSCDMRKQRQCWADFENAETGRRACITKEIREASGVVEERVSKQMLDYQNETDARICKCQEESCNLARRTSECQASQAALEEELLQVRRGQNSSRVMGFSDSSEPPTRPSSGTRMHAANGSTVHPNQSTSPVEWRSAVEDAVRTVQQESREALRRIEDKQRHTQASMRSQLMEQGTVLSEAERLASQAIGRAEAVECSVQSVVQRAEEATVRQLKRVGAELRQEWRMEIRAALNPSGSPGSLSKSGAIGPAAPLPTIGASR